MDKLSTYLEIVPLPVAVGACILVVLGFLAIPAQHRLFLVLCIMPAWLTISRMPDLGVIAPVAKVTSSMGYLLVGLSAMLQPGPRRQLPAITWLYVVMAAAGMLYVMRTNDRSLALVQRLQWLILVVAALQLSRTMISVQDIKKLVNGLTVGCLVAVGLPLVGLIMDPGEAFIKGTNRFTPFGINSNQLGMLLAMSVPLFSYAFLRSRRTSLKPVFAVAAAIGLGMALLTASRQTMLSIALTSLPILMVMTKRPILTVVALGFGFVALSLVVGLAEATAFERLGALETNRPQIWADYFKYSFSKRPVTGLLGVSGFDSTGDVMVGQHPHSAYFNLMYVGGLSLFLPMMLLVIISCRSALRVWRNRHWMNLDPLLVSVLVTLLFVMYIQGLFNQVVYWPTYTWSFLHIILSCFFISLARDLAYLPVEDVIPDTEAMYEDEYEELDKEYGYGAASEALEDEAYGFPDDESGGYAEPV